MRRAAGKVHPAAPDFNGKQHVEPLEPDRLDTEEVDGHHAVRWGTEELPLRGTAPRAGWTELVLSPDLLDGGF